MSRIRQNNTNNESFICKHCGTTVVPILSGGRQRNHCPECLWSRHVDLAKGDRRCGCRGEMEPIGVWVKPSGEWSLIHKCVKCGFIRTNRIAADDNEILLFNLAARPITMLPFPVDNIDSSLKGLEKII
ncbi:MAG: RNHCP domain-containing protein [Spirochaetales bacterium]|nr:RNHCP domain-containing protein [Spirochaetales bacterium]